MLNDWSEEKASLYNTTIRAIEGEAAGESAGEVEWSQSSMNANFMLDCDLRLRFHSLRW